MKTRSVSEIINDLSRLSLVESELKQELEQTIEQENYYAVRKSDDPPEALFPPKLKEICQWLTFKEEFQAYLRMKRGVNKTPLLYVIQKKNQVSDAERNGQVGPNNTDT